MTERRRESEGWRRPKSEPRNRIGWGSRPSGPGPAAGGRRLRSYRPMRRFDLVAFDLYGTLLDISGLAARMRPVAGDGAAALLSRWRKAQIERTWRLNREGGYEPWDRVTVAALEEVAPELPVEIRERLAQLWLTVPAFADAAATLA